MSSIIRVDRLSKQYSLGERQARYATLRESLMTGIRTPWRVLRQGRKQAETIWALRDVSFEVQPGEIVGIIGRNGAGKSTLLKVLSRITEPTSGGVDLYGRVGSLLEVGTGFHPELTGRENVYLSGALLGMSRREIECKFDEIVAFAEIETFLDTPVKRYSSGMYTRLAFAVAAHLETEILLVDEVLAVGDARFQKRCLGKLEDAGQHGRTVLFVSHNMPMVLRLCRRALLLSSGELIADGAPHEVIQDYLHSDRGFPAERVWESAETAPGNDVARLHAVRVLNDEGEVAETLDIRQPFSIEVEYWNCQSTLKPTVSLHFVNEDGLCLFVSNDFNDREWWIRHREPGLVRARCHVPGNFLAEGRIFVLAAVCSYNPDEVHALERDAVSFQIVDPSDGDGVRGPYAGPWPGLVRPSLEWNVAFAPDRVSSRNTVQSLDDGFAS